MQMKIFYFNSWSWWIVAKMGVSWRKWQEEEDEERDFVCNTHLIDL